MFGGGPVENFYYDDNLDETEFYVTRYKPERLDALCKTTKFSRKEIRLMYQGFKQDCPTGVVTEETFKDIFAQFFPQGDSTQYAHYVFKSFKQTYGGTLNFEIKIRESLTRVKQNGITAEKTHTKIKTLKAKRKYMTENSSTEAEWRTNQENIQSQNLKIEQFLSVLSLLSRGSVAEKLQWVFNLYDINGDGYITKQEMLNIVSAIYDMLGHYTDPAVTEHSAKEHVENIFHLIDSNKDGVVTMDEFMEWCQKALISHIKIYKDVRKLDSPDPVAPFLWGNWTHGKR